LSVASQTIVASTCLSVATQSIVASACLSVATQSIVASACLSVASLSVASLKMDHVQSKLFRIEKDPPLQKTKQKKEINSTGRIEFHVQFSFASLNTVMHHQVNISCSKSLPNKINDYVLEFLSLFKYPPFLHL
jgi:hypothetical protein